MTNKQIATINRQTKILQMLQAGALPKNVAVDFGVSDRYVYSLINHPERARLARKALHQTSAPSKHPSPSLGLHS